MSLEDIDKFVETLNRLEGKILGPQVITWLQSVTDPEYELVGSVIDTFAEHINSKTVTSRVLRLLRQLSTHMPDIVLPQITLNQTFLEAIAKYIRENAGADVSEDAYALLARVHQEGGQLEVDKKLVEAVFESLAFVQNEATYRELICFLIDISSAAESEETSLVIQVAAEHKNRRYFGEVLLLMLNRSRAPFLLSVLKVVGQLMKHPDTAQGFFYSNDLEALGDIVINAIEDSGEPELQLKFLEFLDILFNCDNYLALEYRVADFYNLLKTRSEDESNPDMQAAARQALTYLVLS